MVGSPSPYETARYRIRVSGRLDAAWSERTGGMTLVVHDQDPCGVIVNPGSTRRSMNTWIARLNGVADPALIVTVASEHGEVLRQIDTGPSRYLVFRSAEDLAIVGEEFLVMAGPCSVESAEQTSASAPRVRAALACSAVVRSSRARRSVSRDSTPGRRRKAANPSIPSTR